MEYSKERILALISHIHRLSSDFTKKFLSQKGGYASSHGFILYLLSCEEELSMGEIAERINRDKSTATALIKKLNDEGLTETFTSPDDNRKKIIRLTQKGRDFNSFTSEISSSLLAECWKDFTEDEQEQLLALLQKISRNLEATSIKQ